MTLSWPELFSAAMEGTLDASASHFATIIAKGQGAMTLLLLPWRNGNLKVIMRDD